MEYSIEWQNRIKRWTETLAKDLYTPLGDIAWEGFTTRERLGYTRAMAEGDFRPMPVGTKWGREWEYLWVRGHVTVPAEAAGTRLVLNLDAGGESAVYVDGAEFGCRRNDWVRDNTHRISDLVLSDSAVPGTTYEVVLEAYAGHEFPGVAFGPVIPGSYQPKDPEALRCTVGTSTFGTWNEDAYQLYLDVKNLHSAYRAMCSKETNPYTLSPEPPRAESLRSDDIWQALKKFTLTVNFEQDAEGRRRDYIRAREELAPVMACHNGSTAPQFYAFGHAHIDVAWLWPLAETERKVHRTFAAQVAHMDRYPDYKFLQSQPHLYRMVKELYPALYARIKEKVAAGQWIPEGGMWVEADTNISSGEALIRQFVHGKRFFKDEFGVDNRFLWLPDVFGYSAALPQIMKGCGIDGFSTQKIWWTYNGGDLFPYNDFYWQGLDGSAVRTFLHVDYCSATDAGTMINRWNTKRQQHGLRGFMIPFGYGDGGGGPCREFIENLERLKDFEGCPRVEMASPNAYFDNTPAPEDTYVGELYFQCHRGVQTSQAKVKWGNRKCEVSLRETEFLGTLAAGAGHAYPLACMDEEWKQVLLCQFHDILPGSSIKRVYDEAYATHTGVLATQEELRQDMAAALCDEADALTVFNSLSFARPVLATLPEGWDGAAADGEVLPVQELNGRLVAQVTVPSMGSVSLTPAAAKTAADTVRAALTADGALLQNDRITVRFNRRGEIVSAVTADGGEVMNGLGNELKMFRDIPVNYEAWDIDTSYELLPVELPEDAEMAIVSEGALAAALRITRRVNDSTLTQIVTLRADSERVDFDTTVDWRETHKMLKVGFDVDVHAPEALHEIQFGYVRRPTHRSRPFDFDRFEVPNHRWTALCEEGRGAAVLNDCKYGVNVLGTSINLTLLRSPFSPDPECDHGEQHFVYSFFPFTGSLAESGLVREAYDLNVPTAQYGGMRATASALSLTAKNVFVDTMKPAEDGSGDIILRLYEALGTRTATTLTVNLPVCDATACDMLEENGQPVEATATADGMELSLAFRPFEIKTLRLVRR